MAVRGFEQTPRVASSDSKADQNAIRQLVAKYARSVDEADITLAAQVWLDSPEVSFIHPLGHEHGFDQIKQNQAERLHAPDGRAILRTEAEASRCRRPCLRKFSMGRILLGFRSKVQERRLAHHHPRQRDSGVLENAGRLAIGSSLLRDARCARATRVLMQVLMHRR